MDVNFGTSAAGAAAAQAYLMQTQPATPTTGQTVVATDDDKDRTIVLTPAGALADLTITFPSDGASRLGQVLCITTSQAITNLAFTAGPTVGNWSASALAGDFFVYQKVGANTWRRR